MLTQELRNLVAKIRTEKCEGQHLEIKSARQGAPERMYDTLSSFSNQDCGGIIVFGIDENDDFNVTGVYDPHDIQKKVTEQCEQMQPKVRPLFTVCNIDGKIVVSTEIGECDAFDKPCFYVGRGRVRGSYVRIGEADKPMTEYEVYSFEVFKRKIQDELRTDKRATMEDLNCNALNLYFAKIRESKRNFAALDDERILTLQGIVQDGKPTLAGEMLFGLYPQSLFPQYSIIASVVPGVEIGELGSMGERFLDDKRIDGTITQMLDDAVTFVSRNMRCSLIVDDSGKRADRAEYPIKAVREAVLNALVHRDYSIHTENLPIRLLMFDDRIEIENPGGLYGRGTIDNLGKFGFDTRNPYIAGALEIAINSENRYSGIPTMRLEMKNHKLKPPVFMSTQGVFRVTLYNKVFSDRKENISADEIIAFCSKPRSREELAQEFEFETPSYFLIQYVKPLVKRGKLLLTLPDKPKSKNQQYVAAR
ncbi:MAG: ATP-binding protein [Clostridia bacterium]|nr:ATP-binding protein [Clostridia bacterium]